MQYMLKGAMQRHEDKASNRSRQSFSDYIKANNRFNQCKGMKIKRAIAQDSHSLITLKRIIASIRVGESKTKA